MQNGLSKATRLVGCSLESSYSSLPGISAGGYRQQGSSPRVGYASFCGEAPIVPVEEEEETEVIKKKTNSKPTEPELAAPGLFVLSSFAITISMLMF